MALAPGTRLGHYEIVASLGAGGMGEVYRARDARLGRDVAVKVLPQAFADDPDRRARFEREAQTIAALSHPHIVSLFDTGIHDGQIFVVMELLEGETLRERLTNSGVLPVRKVIEYAVQIARGLAAAHDKGLVHRDLKPDNVFLLADGHVKILDFGLARAVVSAQSGSGATETVAALTDPGLVMGTVGYMAPEQVRGRAVDGRADLFAFGVVLFECLTGTRAFQRETPADTMTAILKEEPPDFAGLRADVPPALDRILRHCLEKNPAERFQSARDVAFALEALSGSAATTAAPAASGPVARPRAIPLRELVAWGLALIGIATAVLTLSRTESSVSVPGLTRFDFPLPNSSSSLNLQVVVAPDGHALVMQLGGTNDTRLRFRRMDSPAIQLLPGTEGAVAPFWSPDSKSIGFFVDRTLKKFDIQTSTVRVVSTLDRRFVTPAWAPDGTVLLTVLGGTQPLHRLRPGATQAEAVGQLDAAVQEVWQTRPVFLPDGRRYLYQSRRATGLVSTVLASLDSETRHTLPGDDVRVLWATDRQIVFRRGDAIYAQETDYDKPALVGEATMLTSDLDPAAGPFRESVSAGVLAHMTRSSRGLQFVWYGRDGKRLNAIGEAGAYTTFDLSNDGRRVVAGARSGNSTNLWLIDADRNTTSRITLGEVLDLDPRWSPDATRVIFSSSRHRSRSPHIAGLSAEPPALVWNFDGRMYANDDWSRDGRFLLFHEAAAPAIHVLELDPRGTVTGEPRVVARALVGSLDQAQVSPDGRWVAYNSSDAGQSEVFVVPFAPGGPPIPVTRGGGMQPTWRGDSSELYYLTPDGILKAVKVSVSAGAPVFGEPVELARPRIASAASQIEQYAPHPSGSKFLVLETVGDARDLSVSVMLNWQSLLKKH